MNIIMDELLKEKIPNYEDLKKEQQTFIRTIGILNKYKKSKRHMFIKKSIKEYIEDNNYCSLLSDLVTHVRQSCDTHLTDPVPLHLTEIYLALDDGEAYYKYEKIVTSEHGKGVIYVANVEDEENLGDIFDVMKGHLTDRQVAQLLARTYDNDSIEKLGISTSRLKFNTDSSVTITNLLKLPDIAFEPEVKENIDDDSDDSNDNDTDTLISTMLTNSRDIIATALLGRIN